MKPHCLFFDELYSEHYFREETICNYVNSSDCLIVVGSTLTTFLPGGIVRGMLSKGMPIIEINLESSVNRGYNI